MDRPFDDKCSPCRLLVQNVSMCGLFCSVLSCQLLRRMKMCSHFDILSLTAIPNLCFPHSGFVLHSVLNEEPEFCAQSSRYQLGNVQTQYCHHSHSLSKTAGMWLFSSGRLIFITCTLVKSYFKLLVAIYARYGTLGRELFFPFLKLTFSSQFSLWFSLRKPVEETI